ncbi:MAG TPA: hypothetical protein VGQ02_10030 [Candidatus Limnocylindrales bacterium]|jgi:hypothetical protein|nr:hypothetical protein [Candidatus Limnocylindrales bacterium]
MMSNNRQIVDMIERANDERPFCPCGMHTTPVWRDGVVWLECATLSKPRKGRLARLIAEVTGPAHVHTRIVEVPPAALKLAS